MGAGRWLGVLICVLWPFAAGAQQPQALLRQKVQVTGGAYPLDALDRLVFRQTGLRFSFNAGKVSAARPIRLPGKQYSLQELLQAITRHTGATYVVYKEHIIFHEGRRPSGTPAAAPGNLIRAAARAGTTDRATPPVKSSASFPAGGNQHTARAAAGNSAGHAPLLQGRRTASPALVPAPLTNGPRAENPPRNAAGTRLSATSGPERANTRADIRPVATLRMPVTVINRGLSNRRAPQALAYRHVDSERRPLLYLRVGMLTDDALYVQPAAMAGIAAIHAIAGWGTNFHAGGFRYGLGSSITLWNGWQLHVQATTGKLKGRPVTLDTTRNVAARSHLHRAGLQLEKQLNNRWAVAGGPVFNYLSTSYYRNGQRQSLFSMGLGTRYNDGNLYTVKPLYTITNNFDATRATHAKTWVGLQLSLFYRLNF